MDFDSETLEKPNTGRFSNFLEPTNSSHRMGIYGSLENSGSFKKGEFLGEKNSCSIRE